MFFIVSCIHHEKIFGETGQKVRSAGSDVNRVFEAHAAPIRQVNARFDRENHSHFN